MKYIFLSLCLILSLSSQAQEQLKLLSTWSDSSLPGSDAYNNTYNEIWGFAVNGHEYAVIGSTMGTHIFDVTDPVNIELREFIPGASQGGHIVHRDFHDFNGYLYAVSDESGGGTKSTLQIIDISNLPETIEVVYDDDDLLERCHNIFIDTTAAKLYAMAAGGGDSAYKAVKIYDLTDPVDPDKIGQYGVIGGESFGHVHDGFIDNDKAFFNTGGDGLFIIDFSGDDPVLLDRFTTNDYPQSGYNHSGWPSEDLEYYYFADETWGTDLKVVKVNDFIGIEIGNTFNAGNDNQFSIAHNQIVHCGYLYVSYYYDGIQIYDLADPENPARVFEYATSSIEHRNNYEGAWGVYPFLPSGNILVSDMQEGLFVFEGISTACNVSSNNEEVTSDLNVNIYPNPTNGLFTIDIEYELQSVELLDIHGKSIQSLIPLSTNQYEMPTALSTGIYLLKLTSDHRTSHKRIYLNK